MIDPCCGPRGGPDPREALLSAGQRQLVNVLDPTRLLVHFLELLPRNAPTVPNGLTLFKGARSLRATVAG